MAVVDPHGELVAFLDDDDTWVRDKLARQVSALETAPTSLFSCGRVLRFGGELGPWPMRPPPPRLGLRHLLARNVVACSTVVARRDAVERAGGFDSAMRIGEDYALWLKLVRAEGAAVALPEVLARYRVHAGAISRREESELDELAALYGRVELEWGVASRLVRAGRRRVLWRRAVRAHDLRTAAALLLRALSGPTQGRSTGARRTGSR